MKTINIKNAIFAVLIVLLSLIFNFFSFKNILFDVYKWHIVQPETVHGAIEIALFGISMFLCLLNFSKSILVRMLFICLIMVYLQLHQVLLPAALSVIYFEMIISIGFSVLFIQTKAKSKRSLLNYLKAFLIGFMTWCIIALICSLVGYGSFDDLRVMTTLLGLLSIIKPNLPLTVHVFKRAGTLSPKDKFSFVAICSLVMIQFAKSNRALDYDSLWYGLRPEQVLVGGGSFFDNLGMIMSIHFYPKLMELFYLPVSNLGDYSFILSANIVLYSLLMIVIYLFMMNITNNQQTSLFVGFLLGCIPAISNMASTAKTDIFSSFFLIVAAFFLWEGLNNRSWTSICYGLSSGILSLGGKITSLMYVPLLFTGFSILLIFNVMRKKGRVIEVEKPDRILWKYIILSSIGIVTLICFRTYKLTGYPFYPILSDVWKLLGFNSESFFFERPDNFVLSEDKEFLSHWLKIIFNPEGYTHYIMVWPSNLYIYIWILVLIVLIIFHRKINYRSIKLFLIFIPVFISGIYSINSLPQGGDGNYYIPVIILATVALVSIIECLPKINKKIIMISLSFFIPIQLSLMFVSHFSWSWGTSKFTGELTSSNFESYDKKLELFEQNGLLEIEQYLKDQSKTSNCIGFLRQDGDEQIMNQLSCRFEDVPHMSSRYGNFEIFNSIENFKQYLLWANVKYIILPKRGIEGFPEVRSIINELKKSSDTTLVDAREFYLLEVTQEAITKAEGSTTIFDDGILSEGWYDWENTARWVSDSAVGTFISDSGGTLVIEGTVPDVLNEVILKIQIDNRPSKEWRLQKGDFRINYENLPVGSFQLEISTNKHFIPKKAGINEDARKLSVLIRNMEIK
ncbi:hypothetical protein ACH6EH_19225 [Paenibacillus sp. JSM ZJ436]|uniref:hypothetical protein n=1 Tax=Paenibacillus sp. JSM ZJ436 TaxID=3376190 RepID=UPI0037A946E2